MSSDDDDDDEGENVNGDDNDADDALNNSISDEEERRDHKRRHKQHHRRHKHKSSSSAQKTRSSTRHCDADQMAYTHQQLPLQHGQYINGNIAHRRTISQLQPPQVVVTSPDDTSPRSMHGQLQQHYNSGSATDDNSTPLISTALIVIAVILFFGIVTLASYNHIPQDDTDVHPINRLLQIVNNANENDKRAQE